MFRIKKQTKEIQMKLTHWSSTYRIQVNIQFSCCI